MQKLPEAPDRKRSNECAKKKESSWQSKERGLLSFSCDQKSDDT